MKNFKKRLVLGFLLLSIIAGTNGFLNLSAALAENAFRISGSTTIQPLSDSAAELYKSKYGESVQVDGGGSGAGVKDALEGTSALGAVSRALKTEEKEKLKFTTVAHDALVIIVNEANPITNITKQNLIDIYSQKVSNWKELGSKDMPLMPLRREPGGTLESFEKYTDLSDADSGKIGKNGVISEKILKIESNYELAKYVSEVPNAVGFTSFGNVNFFKEQGMPIKVISLEGIVPTKESIKGGTYPVARELNYVYTQENPKAMKFLELLTTPEGQKLIEQQGFLH